MGSNVLKLELLHFPNRGKIIYKEIAVESDDVKLIDCIRLIVGEDSRISFGEYYANTNLMNYDCLFPYIISDGVIEWYVPFSNVSIKDFRITHNISDDEVIHIEIDNFGGSGDEAGEIISWIANNWDVLSMGFSDVSSGIAIVKFVAKVYKFFANKKGRVPEFNDVKEPIKRQDHWIDTSLMKLLKVDDPEFMDCILYSMGFEKTNNIYVERPIESNCQVPEDNFDVIWGKTTCNKLTRDITGSIQQFNLLLTDLKCRFSYFEFDSPKMIEEKIDSLLDRWGDYLNRGEDLCFIKLVNPPQKHDIRPLSKDVDGLVRYVRKILDEITELVRCEDESLLENTKAFSCITDHVVDTECENEYDYDYNDESFIEEADFYISPWETLLTKFYLDDRAFELITESGKITAYVEQIYDDDLLLQVFDDTEKLIEFRTVNIFDIKTIMVETNNIIDFEESMPKRLLPSIKSFGISAKEFLLNYSVENKAALKVLLTNMPSPIILRAIEADYDVMQLENPLVQVEILNDDKKYDGVSWINISDVDYICMLA